MAGGVPKIAVIAGPTGSGKTDFAVSLALRLGAEIVNADSMQVYKGMDIGTAKPTLEEMRGIRHHLLDVAAPDEEFNAAAYRAKALPVIEDIHRRKKVCLVVGGTGLYIRALRGGLFRCPAGSKSLRDSLQREACELGATAMHERLKAVDPRCASCIHPNDTVRILRALEVAILTGRRPSELAAAHSFGDRDVEALIICLSLERERLYDRINRRCDEMAARGLLAETRRLLDEGFSPSLKPMKAIGYRHMVSHILCGVSFEQALAQMKTDTRRYAKRQLTWFRKEPSVLWMPPEDLDAAAAKIETFLTNENN